MSTGARGELLFAEAPTGILRLEPSGRVAAANPAASRVLGRSPARLRGRPFLELVYPDDRPMAERQFGDVLRGHARSWTLRLVRGDGAPRRREVRVLPLAGSDGHEVWEMVVFLMESPDAGLLGDEGRQLLHMLENLPGRFVALLDREGVVRHAAGLSRTHIQEDLDVLGTPFVQLVDDDDSRTQVESMMTRVLAGQDWRGVQNHSRSDGTSFPVRAVATPLRAERTGSIQGVMVAARDISREREVEERARRAERLAQLGRTVRSAVLALAGQLEALERPDAAFVEREAALRRLSRIVAGLREFSDPRTARPTYLELGAFLDEELTRRGVAEGLRVQVEAPASTVRIHADPEALRRALDLVLRNAEESMAGMQGRIRIQVKAADRGALVSVTDDGGGISEELLERIFEPLETDKSGHVGLGLPVARALLEQFGARIWAEENSGGGGRIVMELPWSAVPGARSFTLDPLTLGASRTVLVVDDDEGMRRALRKVLERTGYAVQEAWSGRNAVATLMAGRLPDAVITDLRMLDGSGYWLLDQIRQLHPDLLSCTMIVTGDRHRSRALELGCPVLEKPVDLKALLETLDQILPEPVARVR